MLFLHILIAMSVYTIVLLPMVCSLATAEHTIVRQVDPLTQLSQEVGIQYMAVRAKSRLRDTITQT